MNDMAVSELTAAEARDLTDRIRERVTELLPLISEAWRRGAWLALGYQSWFEYCDVELRGVRLPVEERREAVAEFRGNGMSTRAIGSALGVNHSTVVRDLGATGANAPVGPVTGVNGKTYGRPENAAEEVAFDIPTTPEDDELTRKKAPEDPFAAFSDVERDLLKRIREGEAVVVSLRGAYDNLIRWADSEGLYERVDRRSEWGNPFELPGDGDRKTVIANYESHYLPNKPSLLAKLDGLRGKALGCWCAPEPCHADVLAAWAKGRGEQC